MKCHGSHKLDDSILRSTVEGIAEYYRVVPTCGTSQGIDRCADDKEGYSRGQGLWVKCHGGHQLADLVLRSTAEGVLEHRVHMDDSAALQRPHLDNAGLGHDRL